MKKISVIIPVYKVEEYLDTCVKSIINQTYKNLEIILIDDGSPDNCPKMCDEWAKQDERIKVIHKENAGVSMARNSGIDICSGDYIFFCDSDDTINVQTLEILLNKIESTGSDLAISSWKKVNDIKCPNDKTYEITRIGHEVFNNDKVYDLLFNKKIPVIMAPWPKLYKKSILENIRYPQGIICGEDEYVIHKILNNAKQVVFVDLPLYNNTQRETSVTAQKFNEKKLHVLKSLENRVDFTRTNQPKFTKKAILQYLKIAILCYYRAKNADLDKSILEGIKSKIDFYYKKGYKNLLVRLFYICPGLLERIIKFRRLV